MSVYSTFVNIPGFYSYLRTPIRRGLQFRGEKCSNFVLSSHLDPLGDQSDVQELSIHGVYLAYLVLYSCSIYSVHCMYCAYLGYIEHILVYLCMHIVYICICIYIYVCIYVYYMFIRTLWLLVTRCMAVDREFACTLFMCM